MCFWTIQSFLGLIKKNSYFVTHFEFWRYASSHWSWNILNIPRDTRLVWPVFNKRHQLQSIFPHRFYQNCCLRLKPQNLSQFHPKTETQKPQPQKTHQQKYTIHRFKPKDSHTKPATPKPRRIFSVKFSASSSKNPSSLRFRWVFGETKRTGRWPWGFPTLFTGGCDVLAGWTFMKFHFYT